ncbi:MAG: polyphosphate polymerase domain-containing protein [Clostridiales bacterium]|nr:polyphosphate polymerase domain-containing protein [Clostridiales bacterium]
MKAITSFKRYEEKFLISQVQAQALQEILKEHMVYDKFCTNGQVYTIYNIYYDTAENDIIRKSVAKPYYKEKLRLRSYEENPKPDSKVFLELKKKIGKVVNKRRVVLTYKQAIDFVEKGIVPKANDYISEQVIKEIKYFLDNNEVKPTTYISYKRTALFDKDNPEFRLTLDSNILTRREDLDFNSGRYGDELIGKDQRLMEIKVQGAHPMWLVQALSELKIYKSSFSKYGKEYQGYILNNASKNHYKKIA